MGKRARRAAIAAGVLMAVVAPIATAASAVVITPPTARAGKLVQVGPISENGFPEWYRDSNGGSVAPTANAGPDQTVIRGKLVTLDGSASTNAESYLWTQVSGPAVTLTGATTAKPTFTYVNQLLPAAPGPNPTFVFNNAPLVFQLRVTNPAGSATRNVTIRPQADAFTGLAVRYRTGNNEWRISGNTTLLAGQRVSAVLGSTLTGRVIGTPQAVDTTGAFSIRVTGPAPGAIRTVSLVSSTGAVQLAFAVNVTN